jgi:hypothetical protein
LNIKGLWYLNNVLVTLSEQTSIDNSPFYHPTLLIKITTMNSLAGPIFVISTLVASTLGQTTRNYNCARQPTICTNICYYQTCVQPGNDLFNYDPNGDADQKREDSGVTPNPSSRERPCLGLVDGGPGMETDEFPFASMAEGGDGATLICASGAEQRCECSTAVQIIWDCANVLAAQGGVLRQLYRPLNGNGEQFRLALTNTNGMQVQPLTLHDSQANTMQCVL